MCGRCGELWIKLLWRSNWFYNYSIFISCFSKSWPLPCSTAGIHLLRGRLKCVTDGVKEEIPMQYFWHSNWIMHKQYVWKAGSYPEEGFLFCLFSFYISTAILQRTPVIQFPQERRESGYTYNGKEKSRSPAAFQLESFRENVCIQMWVRILHSWKRAEHY